MRIRQTTLAKGVQAVTGFAALLAFVGGQPLLGAELIAAVVGTSGFLAYQGYRLGRTPWHAVEITFQSLPLDPLRPERTGAIPQG